MNLSLEVKSGIQTRGSRLPKTTPSTSSQPSDHQRREKVVERPPGVEQARPIDHDERKRDPVAQAVAAGRQLAQEPAATLRPFAHGREELGLADREGDRRGGCGQERNELYRPGHLATAAATAAGDGAEHVGASPRASANIRSCAMSCSHCPASLVGSEVSAHIASGLRRLRFR